MSVHPNSKLLPAPLHCIDRSLPHTDAAPQSGYRAVIKLFDLVCRAILGIPFFLSRDGHAEVVCVHPARFPALTSESGE